MILGYNELSMKSGDIRKKYIEFFKARGHVEIPSAPLVLENDPTTLFSSSGMQPLVPYLLGQLHPSGKRLVNSQKAIRLQDIDEVGDNRHTTFFEMLGNWSLGDYFKKEQLPWIFEFLTKELGLAPERLYVSVFEGDSSVPKDIESIEIWKELFAGVGIDAKVADRASSAGAPSFAKATAGERIYTYNARKNWWSRSGEPEKMPAGEPGGPDSEVFFDFGPSTSWGQECHTPRFGKHCHPNCDCGRFMEIANSVFMQYQKQDDGSVKELSQKNVDFGGGLERLVASTNDNPDVFTTDMFASIIRIIEVLSKKKYGEDGEVTKAMRIVVDHIKGAIMLLNDGVLPSNKLQGYVLRRLIRRSLMYAKILGLNDGKFVGKMVEPVAQIYADVYPTVVKNASNITVLLEEEALRFSKSLDRGLSEIEKIKILDGKIAFSLYESHGFPWEMTEEIAKKRGQVVERTLFEEEFEKHKALSRTASHGMFKGGLADHSEQTTKLHTATHLLHQVLRTTLGNHVSQKGSNITGERLRFDFSHPKKLTPQEIQHVEDMVNEKIKENLPVSVETMNKDEALRSGALAFFGERYGDTVKVYSIGDPSTGSGFPPFSREICGGPHVDFTGKLSRFTILKEESAGNGIRRIYSSVAE